MINTVTSSMEKIITVLSVIGLILFVGWYATIDKREEAVNALDSHGFTNVSLGDRAWWSCSESDIKGYRFTAVNPAGKSVKGVVCCGNNKGCTVRF